MGHAAREFVQERHGLPAVATRTLALYRRAIALHRGDRAEDAALPAQEEAGS
jgi:hypothetical protein